MDRFKGAPWLPDPDKPKPCISIGGLGSVGSHLTYLMVNNQVTVYGFDFDTVAEANLDVQMLGRPNLKKSKSDAVQNTIKYLKSNSCSDFKPMLKYSRHFKTPWMFACFDSMAARTEMFEAWLEWRKSTDMSEPGAFFDIRMGPDNYWIYAVDTPEKAKAYRKTLFDDSEADDLMCTYKTTLHNTSEAVAVCVNIWVNMQRKAKKLPTRYPYSVIHDGVLFTTEVVWKP